MVVGIVVAAGKSERMGPDIDKAFLSLGAKPVLAWALLAFERCPAVNRVILVTRRERVDAAQGLAHMFGCAKTKCVVAGGATRQASVREGLEATRGEADVVVIHDGCRPCVTPDLIAETVKSARRQGSGVAAVKVTDTIKEVARGLTVTRTIDRGRLWAVQTPQAFRFDLLNEAYRLVEAQGLSVTDYASAVEALGKPVHLVSATAANMKITVPADLVLAAAILNV